MPRTIELGRAVLCFPATTLELWLTTSITISPQQDSIGFDTLKVAQITSLLTSGTVWVTRGPAMSLELDLTLCDEPLHSHQLQQLAEAIIGAPVVPYHDNLLLLFMLFIGMAAAATRPNCHRSLALES